MTLLVAWLSCFPWHVYSHFCISNSSWQDWFSLLYNILFVSTYCLLCYIPILFILFLPSLGVDMSDIPIICMTVWCNDYSSSVWCMCCLSMRDTHLSPYLQFPSRGRPCFPWSHIWYETCYFVSSSTELVIRSRV